MRRTPAPPCGCRTSSTVSRFRTARSSFVTRAPQVVAKAERFGTHPWLRCDGLHSAIHRTASRSDLDFLGKAAGGGFPPCCPGLHERPPCKA
jgi:hypothetical protein